MSREIAKELNNRKDGDRGSCPICSPRADRVPLWKVWQFSLQNPGISPFRNG